MRIADITLAALLIILLLPIYIIIMIAILICMGRPIFYCSKRCGKNNISYTHIKFRTMKPGLSLGRVFFEQERITPLGKLLRRTHLDEIPELWLILIGKNSFVGPRALPQKLLQGINTDKRNSVAPGWTGLAQLYLLRNGQLNKQLQIRLDLLYIRKRSLLYNCRILLATIISLFKHQPLNLDKNATKDRKDFLNKQKKS